MFKKNDPMIAAVKGVMEKGDAQRKIVAEVNEMFGVYSRRALPLAKKAEYDIALRKAMSGELPVINEEAEELLESVSAIWNRYHKNEDENNHAGNRVLLAKHFGTKEEHADAVELRKQHIKRGSLPYGTPLYNKVTAANETHWKKLETAHEADLKAGRDALKPKDGSRAAELESRVAKVQHIGKTIKASAKKGNTYSTSPVVGQKPSTMHDDGKNEVRLKGDSDTALSRIKRIATKAKGELKNIKKQGKLFEDTLDEASKEKLSGYIKKAIAKRDDDKKDRKDGITTANMKRSGGPVRVLAKEADYSKSSVDKAIKGSRKKIGSKEAKMIHAILKGHQKNDEPIKEGEQLDELSNKTLMSYAVKADKQGDKREKGIKQAVGKYVKRVKANSIIGEDLEKIKEEITASLKKKYEALKEDERQAFIDALSEEEIALMEAGGIIAMKSASVAAKPLPEPTMKLAPAPTPPPAEAKPAGGSSTGFNPRGAPSSGVPAGPSLVSRVASAIMGGNRGDQVPDPKNVVASPDQLAAAKAAAQSNAMSQVPGGGSTANVRVPNPRANINRMGPKGPTPVTTNVDGSVNSPAPVATRPATAPATRMGLGGPATNTAGQTAAARAQGNVRAQQQRPRVRKPMQPKRSFGFGAGGSGNDSAGSITNRALGGVNETVLTEEEKPQIKRSLESFLRNKYQG
eukprot:gnl/Spiro4/21593_TR10573_c0_g1_i1.p1 gnl/Spiro4/21593_TR10573_c0_g1~~gnl/Spiro4/21593_TR10573_c0_g1_i1.p1  ORF type:complete len:688 (-),score=93.87 gnl/Spiro4/21593_TR10573_c0_g1_i1:9954-12017(-)